MVFKEVYGHLIKLINQEIFYYLILIIFSSVFMQYYYDSNKDTIFNTNDMI